MTNKLLYMHKSCTGKVRFLDSSDILFHFLRSGPPYTGKSLGDEAVGKLSLYANESFGEHAV